jgi:hypothetical protein
MRLRNQIRRRANLKQSPKQQQLDYDKLRLHFTGCILQGLSARSETTIGGALKIALARGHEVADIWVGTL